MASLPASGYQLTGISHYSSRFRETVKGLGDSLGEAGSQLSDWLRSAGEQSDP